MAQQGRGVIGMIVKNFINSLKPRQFKGNLVGKDHLGNSYYQIIGDLKQKKQRWFEPKDKDRFDQELPAEWESWLRYRRKEPPLEEEVLANAALASQKKLNAAELEAARKPRIGAGAPPLPPPPTNSGQYPTYEEYEQIPGENPRSKS